MLKIRIDRRITFKPANCNLKDSGEKLKCGAISKSHSVTMVPVVSVFAKTCRCTSIVRD